LGKATSIVGDEQLGYVNGGKVEEMDGAILKTLEYTKCVTHLADELYVTRLVGFQSLRHQQLLEHRKMGGLAGNDALRRGKQCPFGGCKVWKRRWGATATWGIAGRPNHIPVSPRFVDVANIGTWRGEWKARVFARWPSDEIGLRVEQTQKWVKW